MMDTSISQKIQQDVKEEFNLLRKDAQTFYRPNYDFSSMKSSLGELVPKMVIEKGKVLLDTMLNYLMDDAINILKPASTDLKNAFYAIDLRRKIKESFTFNIENLSYSFDPSYLYGGFFAGGTLLASGAFTTCTAIFSFIPGGVIVTVISGIATLVLSAVAFKIAFDKSVPKARKQLEDDIEKYISQSEQKVSNWLKDIIEAFDKEFTKFCNEYNFKG
jgi:hypothetical protein